MNNSFFQTGIENCFTEFKTNTDAFTLPEKFTFPFSYVPHPLSVIAATELQEFLSLQADFEHNFGLDPLQKGLVIGKMFGVLVVQKQNGTLGYLTAFSGKLANSNNIGSFVPPVFDMLTKNSFFLKEEEVLNSINKEIELLEQDPAYKALLEEKLLLSATSKQQINDKKESLKRLKAERKIKREQLNDLFECEDREEQEKDLIRQSLRDKHELNTLLKNWKIRLEILENNIEEYLLKIEKLKALRKKKSGILQQQLFEKYQFLNAEGNIKNLLDIFTPNTHSHPPAGAGECCAPKLLHYAYLHNLRPVAMAEFWWGASPKSEVKKHKQFYPACWGKCEPILKHMLTGLTIDENPLLKNPDVNIKLPIVYEDVYIVVINKPAEFLTVPGIHIKDSVFERIKALYPNATGPLIVHRLDMSTSGLLIIAKSKEIHKQLQSQFIKRTVLKRYVALLDGELEESSGIIDLPLRVDLDDRPRQLVCYDFGKKAVTKWEIIKKETGKTLVYFYPITGRTHQLRVHASHQSGLNHAIVGDDLYGIPAHRLHLHAEMLEITHPVSGERMQFQAAADFQ